MRAKQWSIAALFAVSVGVGWGTSAIARECIYPYVAESATVTLVEVTRDGEVLEDVSAWKTDAGEYGVRGGFQGIEVFYEGDGEGYNLPFLLGGER